MKPGKITAPVYRSLSDAELFVLLCNDDQQAYTEIYNRYSGVLYVHAYKRIRDKEEARDIIHELFMTLWSKRNQILLKTELSAYLYRSTRNRVINWVNQTKKGINYTSSLEDLLINSDHVTDHALREKELIRLIEKEVAALPEKMQQVFIMSRNLQLSHKEISEELDISELTVRKQINNALKILRPKLSKLQSLFFM